MSRDAKVVVWPSNERYFELTQSRKINKTKKETKTELHAIFVCFCQLVVSASVQCKGVGGYAIRRGVMAMGLSLCGGDKSGKEEKAE